LLLRVFALLLLILGLVSCGSSPQTEPVAPIQKTEVSVVPEKPKFDTAYFLNQAQQSEGLSRQQWLLKAADSFEDDLCERGLSIAALLLPELESNIDKTQANLIIAECLVLKGQLELVKKYEERLALQLGFDKRIAAVRYALYAEQQRWMDAAEALLKSDIEEPELSNKMWSLLSRIPEKDFQRVTLSNTNLQPWLQLNAIIRTHAVDNQKFVSEVEFWENSVGQRMQIPLPPNVISAKEIAPLTPQKIAVILPLTGRLALQGKALKDGILSAYFNETRTKPELVFIDSARPEEGAEVLQNNEYQLVIGPLIKDNIQVFAPFIKPGTPVVALNRDDTDMPEQEYYYYSLAPEDEAFQLAQHLEKRGLREPVIIAESSSVAQRMKKAFVSYWQANHSQTPLEVDYTDSKTMRAGISDVMGTAPSKRRIRQINALVRQDVKAFERNRRDIDSIVVFANAEQTELINPVIETSISPFADILPVFASSRSHSLEMSNNSYRDLRNLSFIDLPWMLPDHPWQGLSREAQELWPQRTDTEYRLFAMGYDAYNIVPHLRHMALFPEYQFNGLTGHLSLDNDRAVQRHLPWGRVQQDKVVRLNVD
jgi:outer membrane PBP1 activator LpoA protein